MKSAPRDLAAGAGLVLLVFLAFSPWWAAHRLFAPLDVLNELYAPWNRDVVSPEVHNHFTSDAVTQYLIYRRVAERSYAEDGFVGWSGLTGGGRPEYANTMALYGDWTMQLHRFLPFWTAWHLGLIGEFVVAALGMLVFLRSRGISRGAAAVGAAAYAANTQFVLWVYHRWQLGAFAWVPWFAWAVLAHTPGRRRTWVLAPAFLALALLGGSLQTAAITLLVVPALALGMGRARLGPLAAWTALGLALAAFSHLPGALALLEATGASRQRVGPGYPGGVLEPLRSALFLPLQAFPSLLGSPRSMDLAKVLGRDLADLAFFGLLPTVLGIRASFMRRAPAAARWLVALGLLLPLTPLVGLLYHRVQILFVFGGVWAFAWYWDNARDDPLFVEMLLRVAAVMLALWFAASVATLFLEPHLTALVRDEVAARVAAGAAGIAGNAYPEWALERAGRLVPELRIWHPRQLVVVLAVVGSLAALHMRGRRWVVPVLGACVMLELATFAAGWVTFADPVRHPPYPLTRDLAQLRERVGDGRVFVLGSTGVFFPSNTLAWYGISTIQEYESVEVRGMWQEAGRPVDAPALARLGVSHALSRAAEAPGPGWAREYSGEGFVLWRNEHPAARYTAEGGGSVRTLAATSNRRRLEASPAVVALRVAENWSEGWNYRVDGGAWKAVQRSPDGSMLIPLAPSKEPVTVEMRYAPRRRTLGLTISAGTLALILALAAASALAHARRWARPRFHAALGFLCLLVLPAPAPSQATPYVPPGDPAYRDVEALVSAGLVRELMMNQRPWSRLAFARAAEEARARVETGQAALEPRLVEALARLQAEFEAERAQLCGGEAAACRTQRSRPVLREVGAELTAADTPPRGVRPAEITDGTPYSRTELDADINPLLQRNHGRALADGWTAAAEARLEGTLGSHLAVLAEPRFQAAGRGTPSADVDGTLVWGYARAVLGNLSVEVGRNHVPHGTAREYGPAMSDNARGMDMVRVSMERPIRLPWLLRHLGPAQFSAWVGDLGRNRDNPGSKLIVLEGALRPHPNLALGGTLQNQQFGEGIPPANLVQRLRDVLGILPRRVWPGLDDVGPISDKALGLDARLTLPSRGLEFYTEVLTTDDHDIFMGWREALWNDAAWVWGGRVVGLGPEARLDVRVEAGRVGVRPYGHHQFTSGMTLDRRVLGSPLGPLGTGVTGTLTWNAPRDVIELSGAWERYAGDRYRKPEGPAWAQNLLRVEDNPDEFRVRATLDWVRRPAATGLSTTVRLGYEHVTRFDFTARNRSNFLVQMRVGWMR